MDLGTGPIQLALFVIFSTATGVLAAIIGPTYDHLLVPELATGALYPPIGTGGGSGFLSGAVGFSNYLVAALVDPAVVLVVLALGVLYLVRAVLGPAAPRFDHLLPRLVVSVIVANATVPIAGAILGLGGAVYPVVAGFDGGAWQQWVHLGGWGMYVYSWDNGALAFVVAFLLFSIVLLLVVAVAIRDALLAVLLVVLPIFTLLYPIPILSTLARRGWLWFLELTFLPCVVVIPLELAVGSTSIVLVVAYLTVALASPALLSMAGSALTSAGLPGASGAVTGGLQRGLLAASLAVEGIFRPALPMASAGGAGKVLGGSAGQAMGRPLHLALPAFSTDLLGRGAAHLLRHLDPKGARGSSGAHHPTRPGAGWSAGPIRPRNG
jgi:hypothetical protein